VLYDRCHKVRLLNSSGERQTHRVTRYSGPERTLARSGGKTAQSTRLRAIQGLKHQSGQRLWLRPRSLHEDWARPGDSALDLCMGVFRVDGLEPSASKAPHHAGGGVCMPEIDTPAPTATIQEDGFQKPNPRRLCRIGTLTTCFSFPAGRPDAVDACHDRSNASGYWTSLGCAGPETMAGVVRLHGRGVEGADQTDHRVSFEVCVTAKSSSPNPRDPPCI